LNNAVPVGLEEIICGSGGDLLLCGGEVGFNGSSLSLPLGSQPQLPDGRLDIDQ
jgi:hypothetical protein